jgi:hypothetical protein
VDDGGDGSQLVDDAHLAQDRQDGRRELLAHRRPRQAAVIHKDDGRAGGCRVPGDCRAGRATSDDHDVGASHRAILMEWRTAAGLPRLSFEISHPTSTDDNSGTHRVRAGCA